MSNRNRLVVPEARQAVDQLKMEIANDIGFTTSSGMTSEMYPALVNGLSVQEMVRLGEKMLINQNASQNKTISDRNIY